MDIHFFLPPTAVNSLRLCTRLGHYTNQPENKKFIFFQKIFYRPPPNFTNMFIHVVRTSVSIFRSIRPFKPILFYFYFFGHWPLWIPLGFAFCLPTITSNRKTKNSIYFPKIVHRPSPIFTNMFIHMGRSSVSIFRSIRPFKPILSFISNYWFLESKTDAKKVLKAQISWLRAQFFISGTLEKKSKGVWKCSV